MDYDSLAQQNGGTAVAAQPTGGADKYDALATQHGGVSADAPSGPGFFRRAAEGITNPYERISHEILNKTNEAANALARKINPNATTSMPVPTTGIFGNEIKPISGVEDITGTILDAGANVYGGGEGINLLKTGLKTGLIPFIKNTAVTGAKALGVYGAGQSMQEGGSPTQVAKDTATSAVTGAIASPFLSIIPFAPGLIKKGVQGAAASTADGMINSLIKPLMKNFAYSKDPARGILAEGLQGNSIDSLGTAVKTRLQDVGQQIGKTGDQLTDIGRSTGRTLDLTPALSPLEKAMDSAAKTGNDTLLRSLQNVKTALTNELGRVTDEHGTQVIVSKGQKTLQDANYSDAVNFLNDVKTHTRFTGQASDDKALNAATQQVYGAARDIMNKYAADINPEAGAFLKNLNQRYGDLQSADLAIEHRALAMAKNNMFNLAETMGQIGGGTVAISHLLTGDVAGFAHWAGATAIEMLASKTARSVAVQTALAKFLNSLSGAERQAILEKSPDLQKWYEQNHELKQLPAPKEGASQSSNNVPMNMPPPASDEEISRGFPGGRTLSALGAVGTGALAAGGTEKANAASFKENKNQDELAQIQKATDSVVSQSEKLAPMIDKKYIQTLIKKESTNGANEANRDADQGKYGWLVGFTKPAYKDIVDKAKSDTRYKNLLSTIPGFDTPEDAIKSALLLSAFKMRDFTKEQQPAVTSKQYKKVSAGQLYELYNGGGNPNAKKDFETLFNESQPDSRNLAELAKR